MSYRPRDAGQQKALSDYGLKDWALLVVTILIAAPTAVAVLIGCIALAPFVAVLALVQSWHRL